MLDGRNLGIPGVKTHAKFIFRRALRQCFAAFQLLSRWNNFQETSHAESWRELPVPLPTVLNAYGPVIRDNLLKLLKDRGFNHCSSPALDSSWMFFQIHFPAQVAAAPPPPPQTLYVKDEFTRLAKGGGSKPRPGVGGFSASNLARLLTDARGENGNGASDSPSRPKHKQKAAVRVPDREGGK
ncbi:hypothetical protein B0H13DRAFT_2470955 [Mycena leptocephala]|nr:hypothetical protein B0H13DRAFT_2470955 [Mycena leptocephala]